MYEIKKETKGNNDVFIHLYFNGSYVIDSARLVKPITEAMKIEELKMLIKRHKETGTFENIETIYTED
jgi:hypothetical protein